MDLLKIAIDASETYSAEKTENTLQKAMTADPNLKNFAEANAQIERAVRAARALKR